MVYQYDKPCALITGAAGFIGASLSRRLIDDGYRVIGIDNMNGYYDRRLKEARCRLLMNAPSFSFLKGDIQENGFLSDIFARERPEIVVNLAAQAGVRYSAENPRSYLDCNVVGTFELLEAARRNPPRHMMLASTSSVYGASPALPYAETDKADMPLSFYAATKKATEAMAHSYAHLYGLPITMFRFFTVYGPWGRPDMALFTFLQRILAGVPIDVYNHGRMARDFTYIADLVEAVTRLLPHAPPPAGQGAAVAGDSLSPVAPWRVVNIGNARPVALSDFICAIEHACGRRAELNFLPMQSGDVPETLADVGLLRRLTGFTPATPLAAGIGASVAWYRGFYAV